MPGFKWTSLICILATFCLWGLCCAPLLRTELHFAPPTCIVHHGMAYFPYLTQSVFGGAQYIALYWLRMHMAIFLPPMSTVEVIETESCVCVCQHSQRQTVWHHGKSTFWQKGWQKYFLAKRTVHEGNAGGKWTFRRIIVHYIILYYCTLSATN